MQNVLNVARFHCCKRVLALTWFTRLFYHERMGSVDDHMQTRDFTAKDRKLGGGWE